HRTVLEAFYRVVFRKKIYPSITALQSDLDEWIADYNELRPHQGRWCYGRTPMQTLRDARALSREKLLPAAWGRT
ncbi:integrase core domain-containing protein, partial [Bradyrhizobium ottawaense]|uniref:integrase core domain-containing protein n=1 Tax=Bradyrhizobium ottawaense TaxID=931866 RepID=UPI0030C6D8A4